MRISSANAKMGRPRRRSSESGFTLIEVLIALGICTAVLVALLGMLPGSLGQIAQASDMVAHQRITDQVTGEAQLTNWEDFLDMDGDIRYYDFQGTYIPNEMLAQKRNQISYAVKVVLPDKQEGVVYPGEEDPNEFTRRVIIHVANTRSAPYEFRDIENNRNVHTFSSVLARLGSQEQVN